MNVLWVINIPLPQASILMNEKPIPFGGWLVNASSALSEQDNVKLSIAFPKGGIEAVQILEGEKVRFYAFPTVSEKQVANSEYILHFNKILEEVNPDIVHIFGTEYPHTLSMVNVCKNKNKNTVISIQGLVSVYAQHYMACLPYNIQKEYTFRDFIKQDNLIQQRDKFSILGNLEIQALKKVGHVIGRTTWDKACTLQINPTLKYYHCNETLREEFYKHSWDINKCKNHTIFVSQGSYPIKGLHFILEAMPLILKKYPVAKLFIGGTDITKSNTLKEKLKVSSYGKYIKKLIKKNNLQDKVIFTGILNEKQMCEKYLESNVFVCPSSIENSPNSLGEAMILGVPCVASDVGGVSDLLMHKVEGFIYQGDAPYMLAHYVCEIFSNKTLALELSEKSRSHALKTHDKVKNTIDLINIYKKLIINI